MLHIASCVALAPVRDGPSQGMGEEGQRLAWAMFVLSAGQQLWSVGVVTAAPGGRCGPGPLEVRVPACLPRRPPAFARRCLAALDEARV